MAEVKKRKVFEWVKVPIRSLREACSIGSRIFGGPLNSSGVSLTKSPGDVNMSG